jgi:Lipocalin-like domain
MKAGGTSMATSDIAAGLLGTWRLESLRLQMEDTGEVIEPFGPDPRGSIIFTLDGRMMTVITASRRTPPTTEAEMAVAFRSMMAYTGRFTIEQDRVVTTVDAAWNPAWEETRQIRFFELAGDRLTLTSEVQGHPAHPGRTLRGIIVWTRAIS